MALVLGMRENNDVYIGSVRVKIADINSATSFSITVMSSGHITKYDITDKCSVEIIKNVQVSSGNSGSTDLARMVIEAPKEIRIIRGKLRRRNGRIIKSI